MGCALYLVRRVVAALLIVAVLAFLRGHGVL